MALVANASYQILAWSYSFQILYEVSHKNQAERETLKKCFAQTIIAFMKTSRGIITLKRSKLESNMAILERLRT
jgi:phage-related protein